jgi:peptidoglycan hydrolase-like protein with peptidoglycan-binding domain
MSTDLELRTERVARRRAMSKKTAAGLVLVAVVAAALVVAGYRATQGNAAAPPASSIATSLVAVTRRDLTDRLDVSGTLGYGATTTITNHLPGTITSEAALGSVVDRGQALYAVDAKSVILMFGDTPAYRDFRLGMSDGPDVKELEENLLALGYGNSSNLVASGHFDAFDVAAVQRWQKAMGLTQDGVIPWGRIVFAPAAVRINAHAAEVGSSAGPVMQVTSTLRVVTIDLDARRQNLAVAGAAVAVTLASGKVVPGKISDVGRVATAPANGNGSATIKVYVTLDDPTAGSGIDQAPVRVGLASQTHKAVLAVPIDALLVLAGGAYAVEVDHNGARRQVPVQTGLFSEGMVEITGEGISEGTMVVVPAR